MKIIIGMNAYNNVVVKVVFDDIRGMRQEFYVDDVTSLVTFGVILCDWAEEKLNNGYQVKWQDVPFSIEEMEQLLNTWVLSDCALPESSQEKCKLIWDWFGFMFVSTDQFPVNSEKRLRNVAALRTAIKLIRDNSVEGHWVQSFMDRFEPQHFKTDWSVE